MSQEIQRVFVLDPDFKWRSMVSGVAERLGYKVMSSNTASTLIKTFDTFQPNVVVFEVVMPDMDGIELMEWLCEHGKDVRVLVLTHHKLPYAKAVQTIADIKGGMDVSICEKPITEEELALALESGRPSGHRVAK